MADMARCCGRGSVAGAEQRPLRTAIRCGSRFDEEARGLLAEERVALDDANPRVEGARFSGEHDVGMGRRATSEWIASQTRADACPRSRSRPDNGVLHHHARGTAAVAPRARCRRGSKGAQRCRRRTLRRLSCPDACEVTLGCVFGRAHSPRLATRALLAVRGRSSTQRSNRSLAGNGHGTAAAAGGAPRLRPSTGRSSG